MVMKSKVGARAPKDQSYHLRTLSGRAGYLSVGRLVPKGWRNVKVYVVRVSDEECVLRLIPIK